MGHLEMIINIWAVKKDSFLGGSFCIFCTFCIFFFWGGGDIPETWLSQQEPIHDRMMA